jgi:O-antigen ligase
MSTSVSERARHLQTPMLVLLGIFVSWSIAGMQIIAGVLVVLFVLAKDYRLAPELRDRVLAFCAVCAISVLLASPPWRTFDTTAFKPALLVWIGAATVLSTGPLTVERTVQAWMAATAISSAWALVQAFTGLDALHLLHLRRTPIEIELPTAMAHWRWAAIGFFNSRLTYAHALLLPLGVGVAHLLLGRGRTRLLSGVVVLLLGCGLVLSFARGAWWGALIIAIVLTIVTRSRWVPLAAMAALILAMLVPSLRARLLSSVSLEQNNDRVFIWARAREVIADHPVLGVGFGAYPRVAEPYYDRVDPGFPMHTWCHDTPLSLLAEVGPVGLALYVWLWASIYWLGWPAIRKGSPTALGLFAGTLGIHTAALFHDVLYDGEVAYALYLGGALLAGLGLLERESKAGVSESASL